jgi:hypothetical protein
VGCGPISEIETAGLRKNEIETPATKVNTATKNLMVISSSQTTRRLSDGELTWEREDLTTACGDPQCKRAAHDERPTGLRE